MPWSRALLLATLAAVAARPVEADVCDTAIATLVRLSTALDSSEPHLVLILLWIDVTVAA